MAFPASGEVLTQRVQEIKLRAIRVKNFSTSLRNASAAGNTFRADYEQLVGFLTDFVAYLNASAAISGMGQKIVDETPEWTGTASELIAELVTTRNAATTLRDWIAAQIQSTNLYSITTAQTATFRTNVDAFTATVS